MWSSWFIGPSRGWEKKLTVYLKTAPRAGSAQLELDANFMSLASISCGDQMRARFDCVGPITGHLTRIQVPLWMGNCDNRGRELREAMKRPCSRAGPRVIVDEHINLAKDLQSGDSSRISLDHLKYFENLT